MNDSQKTRPESEAVEQARARLEQAMTRLETALAARSRHTESLASRLATEEQGRKTLENRQLQVEQRLDAAIGRLRALVEE